MEVKIGQQTKIFADHKDKVRLKAAARRALLATKETRTARRLEELEKQELFEEAESLLYGPGIAD